MDFVRRDAEQEKKNPQDLQDLARASEQEKDLQDLQDFARRDAEQEKIFKISVKKYFFVFLHLQTKIFL